MPSSFMISIRAPAGCSPARACQVDRRLGVSGASQHTLLRARRGLICPGRPRSAGFVEGSARARIVAARSWIDTPVVQSWPSRSTVTVKGVPRSEVLFSSHHVEAQFLAAFLRQRGAEDAATLLEHEVDDLGGDFLRGDDEIALVFTVFVIDDDHDPAVAEVLDDLPRHCSISFL